MIILNYCIHETPLPLEYEVCQIDGRSEITIVRKRQEDGGHKWAVMRGGSCLSTDGDWAYESLPSSRPDDWIDRYRFEDFDAAWVAAQKAAKTLVEEERRRVDIYNERARAGSTS